MSLSSFSETQSPQKPLFQSIKPWYEEKLVGRGVAAPLFQRDLTDWEKAQCYQTKIVLIDSLLHEFHRSLVSGTVHRPVAMNFIDGTRKSVEALLQELSL